MRGRSISIQQLHIYHSLQLQLWSSLKKDTHLWNRQCCCDVDEEVRSDVSVCNSFRICDKLALAKHYGAWINICSEKSCSNMNYKEHVDKSPKMWARWQNGGIVSCVGGMHSQRFARRKIEDQHIEKLHGWWGKRGSISVQCCLQGLESSFAGMSSVTYIVLFPVVSAEPVAVFCCSPLPSVLLGLKLWRWKFIAESCASTFEGI